MSKSKDKPKNEDESRVTRSVVIPVSLPLGDDPNGKPWSFETLGASLNGAFRLSTDLANWAVHLLYRRDTPGTASTPDAVRVRTRENPKGCYLYGEASKPRTGFPGWKTAWESATTSAQSILRDVHRKYLQNRFDIMCRHEQSLLTYRYPQPFPIHNRDWRTGYVRDDDGRDYPCVSINLPGVGKVQLRLKQGKDFARQIAMFGQIHREEATKGAAAIYRNRKGQLLVKMVGAFARPPRESESNPNVCFLHTDPSALLVAEINGRSVTVTNADHLRRAHVVLCKSHPEHKTFLQRASEDKKRELRMHRTQRHYLKEAIETRCDKNHRRITTAVQQIAAQVARFCERQRVGMIVYDDSCKRFLPDGFAWHALKTRLQQLFIREMGGEWIEGGFAWRHSDAGSIERTETKEREAWLRAQALSAAGKRKLTHLQRPAGKSHPAVSKPPAISSVRPGTRLKNSSTTPSPTSKKPGKNSTA